jgi:hypothetical protein
MLRLTFLPLVLAAHVLHAQQASVATGGDAGGAGGSMSYTVGQPACITLAGAAVSLAQGVQQPYEISVTTGIGERADGFTLAAWPNPTAEDLELTAAGDLPKPLRYQLHDAAGQLLAEDRITTDRTRIPMAGRAAGTYLFGVLGPTGPLRTFRIVKH